MHVVETPKNPRLMTGRRADLIVALTLGKIGSRQMGRAMHPDLIVGDAKECGRWRYANGGGEYAF
jgi:hypothetical protein